MVFRGRDWWRGLGRQGDQLPKGEEEGSSFLSVSRIPSPPLSDLLLTHPSISGAVSLSQEAATKGPDKIRMKHQQLLVPGVGRVWLGGWGVRDFV